MTDRSLSAQPSASWHVDDVATPDDVARLVEAIGAADTHLHRDRSPRDLLTAAVQRRLVVRDAAGHAFGFVVASVRGAEAELLDGGVLQGSRRQGAARRLLRALEQQLADDGCTSIRATLGSRTPEALSLLAMEGYRIVQAEHNTEDRETHVHLHRMLRRRKEIRISLTGRCNFKCFFCHNEGLENTDTVPMNSDVAEAVLEEAVRLGCSDITFTGGEPLLERARLRGFLTRLASLQTRPDVTVVTNGLLLDDDAVEMFRQYPGQFCLHVSLHASDAATFARVTGTRPEVFERTTAGIRRATAAGLRVKMNHVVLQGVNHRREQLLQAIELGRDLRVASVKLLELLVVSENAADFQYFYDASAVRRDVETIASGPRWRNLRTAEYRHLADPSFTIEVACCTCRLGCARCKESRDRTIDSAFNYHPCFVRGEQAFPIAAPAELERVLLAGDRVLEDLAARFGDSSPTLARKEQAVAAKRELFFRVDDASALRAFLQGEGFSQTAAARFHEEYYRPANPTEEWLSFQRVAKLSWDHHDPGAVGLVYADLEYAERVGEGRWPRLLETASRFLHPSGPLLFSDLEQGRRLLDRLGLDPFLELDWELILMTRPSAGPGDPELAFSLAVDGARSTLKVPAPFEAAAAQLELLARFPGSFEPLREPLMAFMTSGQRAEVRGE